MPLGAFKAALMGTAGASAAGDVVLLTTATASGSSELAFTSGLDSTYGEYIFKFYNLHPSASNPDLYFQTSVNGGSAYANATTTTMFRTTHKEDGSGGALSYRDGRDNAQTTSGIHLTGNSGNDADQSTAGEFHLFNPASTTYVKHFIAKTNGLQTGSAFFYQWHSAGYVNVTDNVDAIKFYFSSGNIDTGVIKMWGVK